MMILMIDLNAVVDFHVGNVDSNCKQFEKQSDSDKEGLMKASDNRSKVIKYPQLVIMFQFKMYV